jgi:hypothetical protein
VFGVKNAEMPQIVKLLCASGHVCLPQLSDQATRGKSAVGARNMLRFFSRPVAEQPRPAYGAAVPHSTPLTWREEFAAERHTYVHRDHLVATSAAAPLSSFRNLIFLRRTTAAPAPPRHPPLLQPAQPAMGRLEGRTSEDSSSISCQRRLSNAAGTAVLPSWHALDRGDISLDSLNAASSTMLPPPPTRHALEGSRRALLANESSSQWPSPPGSRPIRSFKSPSSREEHMDMAVGPFSPSCSLETRRMSYDVSSRSRSGGGFIGRPQLRRKGSI